MDYKKLTNSSKSVQNRLLTVTTPEAMTAKELALWGNLLAKTLAAVNRQLDEGNTEAGETKGLIIDQLSRVTDCVEHFQDAAEQQEGGEDEPAFLTVVETTKLFQLAEVCAEVWAEEGRRQEQQRAAQSDQKEMPQELDLTAITNLLRRE